MKSINYWTPTLYRFFLRWCYGHSYTERYQLIKDLIEPGASVTDVCCGDCALYDFLAVKKVRYCGVDFNERFVTAAHRRGITAWQKNLLTDSIPEADYIVIQGSLYQFYPQHPEVLNKLYAAAQRFFIVSEPVNNFGGGRNMFWDTVGAFFNNPGDGVKKFRFNRASFRDALAPFMKYAVKELSTADNRDCILVFAKRELP